MIVDVYSSELEDSITCVIQNDKRILAKDSILLRTIEGVDWDDCMIKHYELMNWKPYKPF